MTLRVRAEQSAPRERPFLIQMDTHLAWVRGGLGGGLRGGPLLLCRSLEKVEPEAVVVLESNEGTQRERGGGGARHAAADRVRIYPRGSVACGRGPLCDAAHARRSAAQATQVHRCYAGEVSEQVACARVRRDTRAHPRRSGAWGACVVGVPGVSRMTDAYEPELS